jgi:3-oxoadipate enol-lactonase
MENGFKECNGQKLYYKIHGEGEPLLLIMGLGGDSTAWMLQIPAFSKYFKVIVFDNRDVGRSSLAKTAYTIADMAEDTAGLMNALGIQQANVLGGSMGGFIAQELVIHHPGRIKKLVLACTTGQMARFKIDIFEPLLFIRQHDPSNKTFFSQMMFQTMTHEFLKNGEAVNQMLAFFQNPPFPQPIEAFVRQVNAIRTFDALDRLQAVKVPTLVLVGDQDIASPPWAARELASAIPGATLKVLEGGAHGFNFEIPDRFNQAVLEFLMKKE